MAGSLTDWFARVTRLPATDRRLLLIAALAGGFGAVFGVPLTGVVFALEVQRVGRLRFQAVVPAIAAPFVGGIDLSAALVGKVAVAGLAFGLLALLFTALTHGIRRLFGRWPIWPPLRPFLGAVVVVVLTVTVGNRDYNGLSIPLMTAALAGGAVMTFASPGRSSSPPSPWVPGSKGAR